MDFKEFKTTLKIFLRNKSMIFRALVFPLILGCLFKMALGGVTKAKTFSAIRVGVSQEAMEDENFKEFLQTLEDENVFKITKNSDEESFKKNDDLVVLIKNKNDMVVKSSGMKASIVQEILDRYLQEENKYKNIAKENPKADFKQIASKKNRIIDKSSKKADFVNTFFYTLLAMQLLYGYGRGVYVIYLYEANQSELAKRRLMSPVKKTRSLFTSFFVARLINFFITAFSSRVLAKFMGVDFGDKPALFMTALIIGSFTGVILGGVIASTNKKDISFKNALGISITMVLSFFAGMMNPSVKLSLDKGLPRLNKINPAAVLTDSMTSLYYYQSTSRFTSMMIRLTVINLIMFSLVYILTRRRQYDSL